MKEIFSLLRQKERNFLGVLCLLLLVALTFYIFFGRGMKGSSIRAQNALANKQKQFKTVNAEKEMQEKEWGKWQQTVLDLDELSNTYFYKRTNISQEFRKDIEEIFTETGIATPPIRYEYQEKTLEKIDKATATFNITGPYPLLKNFVYIVENFPKFLIVERIDFMDINTQAGSLNLKIVLVGYYED